MISDGLGHSISKGLTNSAQIFPYLNTRIVLDSECTGIRHQHAYDGSKQLGFHNH